MLRCFEKQDKWEGLDLFVGSARVDDLVDLYLSRPRLAEATNNIAASRTTVTALRVAGGLSCPPTIFSAKNAIGSLR
jgi:hypothetical protein